MIKYVLLIACLLVFVAAGASFAQVGTIQDPGYETGGGWDGTAGATNTWFVSGPWDANRVRLESAPDRNLPVTQGNNACLVDVGTGGGGGTGANRTTGYISVVQDGWNAGSGNDATGDIWMAPGTSYKVTVDVLTYGDLFNGGGMANSTNWVEVGAAYEGHDAWYWGSKNSLPVVGKVIDYSTSGSGATANAAYETESFIVTNSDPVNYQPVVLGFVAAFGPGNASMADGSNPGNLWAGPGFYKNNSLDAFACVDNWTMTVVPEPASLLALGCGLIGLVGSAFRARKH